MDDYSCQCPVDGCACRDMDDYQRKAHETAVYPSGRDVIYPILGLSNEVGELVGALKKVVRGDYPGARLEQPDTYSDALREKLVAEMGDVLWYLAEVATALHVGLGQVAEANLRKLADRSQRGVIKGSGDTR